MIQWPPEEEAAIASQVPRLPPWGRLEQVALHLADHEQHRDLIVFVEAWARHGNPTLPARLVLCEAYIALRLMDRAWARLRPIVDEGRGPLQAVRLAARYLLLRGWAHQARGMAEAGLERAPDDEELRRLRDDASRSAVAPEDRPDPDTLSDLLRLAEAYMARGALVKAQGLLERARRRAHPQRVQRVEDLLWAMLGDFGTEASLEQLCQELGPEPEPPETTERMGNVPHDPAPDPVEDHGEGFRQLFRDLEAGDGATDAEEDTSVSHMAGEGELRGHFDAPPRGTDGAENTEILRVVRRAPEADPISDASSIPSDSDYLPGAEVEDDIVVLTRRDPSPPPGPSPHPLSNLASDKVFEDEARTRSQAPRRPKKRTRTPSRARPRPIAPPPPDEDDAGPLWPWVVVAAVILVGSAGMVFLVGALFGAR